MNPNAEQTLVNALGQPIGAPQPDWSPRPRPTGAVLEGRLVRLERLDAVRHGNDLWQAYGADTEGRIWTYLGVGPFTDRASFDKWLTAHAADPSLITYALIARASAQALGIGSYLRIDPSMGSVEIGHLCFAPALARSTLSTEAHYLWMRHAFDALGYRRYEWKCDSLNGPSKRAAERLGFRFEGVHRQARVYKGRNRDTAWYSILDSEWPALRQALECWLAADNFDFEGRQRRRLEIVAVEAGAAGDAKRISLAAG